MSAFGRKADFALTGRNVRLMTKADIGCHECRVRFRPETKIKLTVMRLSIGAG